MTMNKVPEGKSGRLDSLLPGWLREEWVWEGLLVALVAPVVVYEIVGALGGSTIV
jgi:hypothetical protein